MNLFFDVVDRLAAGFLIAWALATAFGPNGSPVGYLASLLVAGAVTAILLDKYGQPIVGAIVGALGAMFGRGESPEPVHGPKPG